MRGNCGFTFGNGCSDGDSDVSLFGGNKPVVRKVIPVTLKE
jgi:nitrate reductase beta subunit